jgi:hypothetical protein
VAQDTSVGLKNSFGAENIEEVYLKVVGRDVDR